MSVAAFFSTMAIIFAIPPLCATSKNKTTVKNVAWSVGTYENYANTTTGKMYVGLSNVVVCADDDCDAVSWSDSDCDLNLGESDTCQQCKDAATGALTLAIASLVSNVPTLLTDLRRRNADQDTNCDKFLAIFTATLGFCTATSTVAEFSLSCYDNLNGGEVEWELGSAFICLIMVVWMKPVNAFLHYLVPTPPRTRAPLHNELKDNLPGYASTAATETELSVSGRGP